MVVTNWKFIFFPLTSRKCDLVEVEKAMFKGLGILIIPKCDLVDVEKAMFEQQVWQFQHISGFWISQKCGLFMFKRIFLVVSRHCEVIFCSLTSPKCDLDEVEKEMFEIVECHFEFHLWYLSNRKCKFFQVDKGQFKWMIGT